MGTMRMFRTRSGLVAGAIGLAMLAGVAGIVASAQAGVVHAEDIPDTQFEGVIEALPEGGHIGIWQVGGRQVLVTEFTEIDNEGQALVPGTRVEVEGIGQEGGSVLATEIEVEHESHGAAPGAPAIQGVPAIPSIPGLPNIPGLPGARP
jgi:hypothetical protein